MSSGPGTPLVPPSLPGRPGLTRATRSDARFVRSAMYGSFLAGHVYGAEGIWGGDIEDQAPVKMWDAFQWISAN